MYDDGVSYKTPSSGPILPESFSASGPQPAVYVAPASGAQANNIRPPAPAPTALPTTTRRPYPQRLPSANTGAPSGPRPIPTTIAPLPPPPTTTQAPFTPPPTTAAPTTPRPYTYPSYPAFPPYHNYNPNQSGEESEEQQHGNSGEQQSFDAHHQAPEPTSFPSFGASEGPVDSPNFPETEPSPFPAYPTAGDISADFPPSPEPNSPSDSGALDQPPVFTSSDSDQPSPYGRESGYPSLKQRKEQRQRTKQPVPNDDPFFSRINNDDPYGPFQFKDIFGGKFPTTLGR